MLDRSTVKGRIVDAALKLAEARSWRDVTLMDIASEAGVTLLDLKGEVRSKDDIVGHFIRAVDDEVLRRSQPQAMSMASSASEGEAAPSREAPRDRIFGVIMSRFDVLQPYRGAIRSIMEDGVPGPGGMARSAGRLLRSQHWMLAAAGIPTDRAAGTARTVGLAAVYADVLRTWLKDEDPGMAKTMAVLDNRLRSGERWLRAMDDMEAGARRLHSAMPWSWMFSRPA
jgi:ubiquinone biosynthesis protein COQ9